MSNRDDDKRGQADDRTLLDPLSNDELEQLRRARQKLQSQRKPRQMVVGPSTDDENLGSAPTRTTPLPSFDGRFSLDKVGAPQSRVTHEARDPASYPGPNGPAPSEPMSVYQGGDEPTLTPGAHYRPPGQDPSGPTMVPPGPAPAPGPARGGGRAGQTGFGENTLMWMSPPKVAPTPQVASTADVAPIVPPASVGSTVKRYLLGAVFLLALVGIVGVFLINPPSGVIELHSDPIGATVVIDGQPQTEKTPMKLTMAEGEHVIELSLEGYEGKTVTVAVDAEKPGKSEVVLEPKSAPGMLTVTINVQPVAAKITVDGEAHASKRTLRVANLDPKAAHTFVVEAAGYKKLERKISAGELKDSYNFPLQADPDSHPE